MLNNLLYYPSSLNKQSCEQIMKNYEIIKPFVDMPDWIRIVNRDDSPTITEIDCRTYFVVERLWSIEVKIQNETDAMRKLFHTVPGAWKSLDMNFEKICNQTTMENIIQLFKIIQQIDPVPLSVFSEIKNEINLDLSELLNHGSIQQQAEQGNYSNALQLALEATTNGDDEALPLLANIYQEKGDISNYIIVLNCIPAKHPLFVSANEEMHNYLLTLPVPQDQEEKIILLEKKFKAALNSNDTKLSTCYFNELIGKGLQVNTSNIRTDADTLIEVARDNRKMRKELEDLRSYKARNEARFAAERRFLGNQTPNNNNSNNTESDMPKPTSNRFF